MGSGQVKDGGGITAMTNNVNTDAPKRSLSLINVWAMAFGCMVGWGTFGMPGTTFLPIAGPCGTIIAMTAGMLIMLVIGYNFAYLINRNPRSGGVYSYTKEAFGRDHAFLSSWFLCLSYLTIVFLNGTSLFIVLRTIFGELIQTGLSYTVSGSQIYIREIIVSAVTLAGVGLLFLCAKPMLRRVHTALSIILLAGILILGAFCLPHTMAHIGDFGSQGTNKAYGIFSIVFLAPWAFVGFEVISFDTESFKFPIKKSKGIIFAAIILAAAAYTIMAVIGISAVPDGFENWQSYINSLGTVSNSQSVPTIYAAKTIMGNFGFVMISITAMAAVLTGIIGGYRATISVLTTMAEDNILSKHFSKTVYNIVFVMIISIILVLFGRNTLEWFVDLTSFGAIVGFGYTSAAAYKLSKAEGKRRSQITGMIGTIVSVVFVVVQLVPRLTAMEAMGGEAFLLLSFWCLLGFVFYWRTVERSTLAEYSGMSTSGVVLFALIIYSAFMWLAKQIDSKETIDAVHSTLVTGGTVLLLIIFAGLVIMLYVQELVRKKHEASEREKIRAMEGSLAKSRFLFNMSHDIRTPMNAIIGYTELALKEPSSEVLHDYLVKIDRSNQHLLTLINDILEMSRIESGKVELELSPTDLCRVFDSIRELFDEQMKRKNMEFELHTSQVKHRYVWCDAKHFSRVIVNLLSNAYKFTDEGGSVTASIAETGSSDGYGVYEIRVRDNGIGMSKEFVEKMFSPFERERTSTVSGIEGTGLGLSISKNIIDLMGGTIDVHTSPGSGTEIVLNLKFRPAEESDVSALAETKAEQVTDIAKIDFSGKRLLLVEDNEINMEIAKMILTQAGFTVETAENGKIAVDMISSSAPGYYAAVLMDIQMPVMDGYTATKAIRSLQDEKLSSIPILAMTANAFKEDEEAAFAAGMQAHIAKPVDVEKLLGTLTEVLSEYEK